MGRLKYVLSSINIVNILLSGLLIYIINYMILPFFFISAHYTPSPVRKKETADKAVVVPSAEKMSSFPSDYSIIAEQNLFHPQRKISVEIKEAQPLPVPNFVLSGTLITPDLAIAYMEDKKAPYSTPGREKRQTPLKLGESLSGFTLREVETDRVTMVRGEEKIIVPLNDPQKPRVREAATVPQSAAGQSHQFQTKPSAQTTQAPSGQQQEAPAVSERAKPTPVPPAQKEKAVNTFLDFFKSRMKP